LGLNFYRKSISVLPLAFFCLTVGCNSTIKPAQIQTANLAQKNSSELRQWATSARASTEYSNPHWAASQAVGEPDVETCGDNTNAWASKNDNTVEWLELEYRTPVFPTEINIYQSYHPSQVVEVVLFNPTGDRYIVWEGYPEPVEFCPDLMNIQVDLDKKTLVNKIRISIDQQVNGWGWNEIDAVELVGTRN
jgi:hypothetical protein